MPSQSPTNRPHADHASDVTDRTGCQVTIINERGLHARAAAKFVKLTDTFDAEVTVTRAGTAVSGRSIMGLLMLAAGPGTEILIEAEGQDADRALAALIALVNDRFGEEA